MLARRGLSPFHGSNPFWRYAALQGGIERAAERLQASGGKVAQAPAPKAAVTRDARPYPVEAPSTRTFFGPWVSAGWDLTWAIHSWTCAAQPAGWAVMQTKPRTLGLMTIGEKAFPACAGGASFKCGLPLDEVSQTPPMNQSQEMKTTTQESHVPPIYIYINR